MPSPLQTEYQGIMTSPLGKLHLRCSDRGLTHVLFETDAHAPKSATETTPMEPEKVTEHPILNQAIAQLSEYFLGKSAHFNLPIDISGSTFELAAWHTLQSIAYGATLSYRQQAEKMGKPKAARAVGQANGRNPLPIVIPCHRVIGSNGRPGGYIAGSTIKSKLLELEKNHAP
jgi:methylated-DNA-[protein]-cysteine S-methyltransferase